MLFSVFLNLALVALYLLSTYLIKGSISTQEILLLIFSAGVNLFSINKIESQFRKSFNLKIKSDKEIRVTEHLLVQMMPAHVVYRLSEGSSITDQLYDVTILYADIVGFTAWSSGKSPSEVVQMLSNLFTEFDKKCVELGVYKVHTIGDCYVVLGYLTGKRDPVGECWNVFELANYMIQIIEEENQAYGMQLAMRIGIHTGHLVAGVIGNNVVRYDIWGTDVLVANKMESNGKPGVVNVSEVTMKMLQEKDNGELQFDFNKEVHGFSSYFVKRSKIIEDHV
jgi:class 3 adenylate cyclase